MIDVKKGGQHRIVPEHKLNYWLSLGFKIVQLKEFQIDEKQTLQAKLDSLNVEYDGRWSVEKLKEILEGAK